MSNAQGNSTQPAEVSGEAHQFYIQMHQLAMRSICIGGNTVNQVQVQLQTTAKFLATELKHAYSLVIEWLRELESAGWITRSRSKHSPTRIALRVPVQAATTPTAEVMVEKVQSSKFKVQSSKFTYAGKAIKDVCTENKVHLSDAAARARAMNFELSRSDFSDASEPPQRAPSGEEISAAILAMAAFRGRLSKLLWEFGIVGRKREVLADSICALVKDCLSADRLQQVLADCRAQLEHARLRQQRGLVANASAVGIIMLQDYARTGQMSLFAIPEPKTKTSDDASGDLDDKITSSLEF